MADMAPHNSEPCELVATACSTTGLQPVCVTANVIVTPQACCRTPSVTCLGPARIVTPPQVPCPDGTPSPDGTCRFTVAQTILVKVPIDFGAEVECRMGNVFCLPPSTSPNSSAPSTPLRHSQLFTRSSDFFRKHLVPANFRDQELCQAIRNVRTLSSFLDDLLEGSGCPKPGDPCPAIVPLSSLTRLEALLTPEWVSEAVQDETSEAPSILGQATCQLLALLLNVSLSTTTPKGDVGGLRLDYAIDLSLFPEATALLGNSSTIGGLVGATDAALLTGNLTIAKALEPVLSALNIEGTPPILMG